MGELSRLSSVRTRELHTEGVCAEGWSGGRRYIREMSMSVLQVVAECTSWRWAWVCYKWWQTVHYGDKNERVTSGGRGYVREMSMSVLQVVAEDMSGRWEWACYKWWQRVRQGDERERVTSGGGRYVMEMRASVLQVVADGTSGRWEWACYKWWRTVHQGDEHERATSGGRGYIREMRTRVLQRAPVPHAHPSWLSLVPSPTTNLLPTEFLPRFPQCPNFFLNSSTTVCILSLSFISHSDFKVFDDKTLHLF